MEQIDLSKLIYGGKLTMECFPLHECFGIKYTRMLDEETSIQECTIEKYWEDDQINLQMAITPHKVKIVPLDEKYSTESYYWMDFITMIRKGSIKLL